MAESKDESLHVLQLLKTSDDPSADDAARVRAAVWARIGLAGAVTAAAATGVHTLGQGAGAALNAGASGGAANAGAMGSATSAGGLGAGVTGGSLATGTAVGIKAAWVVTVAKVGLAVALLGAGGWYGARTLAPGLLTGSKPAAQEHAAVSPPQPARALLVTRPSVAPTNVPEDEANSPTRVASKGRSGRSDTLDTEMALLGDAQRALSAGQFSAALASLDKHAARFPRGALASEREASRAIALCRSGALARGRKLATRYVTQHASSPLCTRVRAACQLSE